jgi:hypothetical protein
MNVGLFSLLCDVGTNELGKRVMNEAVSGIRDLLFGMSLENVEFIVISVI